MNHDDRIHAGIVSRLVAAGCVAADEEAAEFLAAAPDEGTLDVWLIRRERGEPPAWITGTVLFCGQKLHISPGVYVPRFQTEELARRAASLLPPYGRAVDICTGVGAVAAYLSSRVPTAQVVGIDIDLTAAACARANGVTTVMSDLAAPIARHSSIDVVTAVAPYVPTGQLRLLPPDVQRYEPRLALDGGVDGLDLVRRIIRSAATILRPGGWLFVEIGAHQDSIASSTFEDYGFGALTLWHDDDGDLRGMAAQLGRAISVNPDNA